MPPAIIALILAPPAERDAVVTGLRLTERARRVARQAGVAANCLRVARSSSELAAQRAALEEQLADGRPLLVVRAADQLVAAALVEPLLLAGAGTSVACIGDDKRYAGALRCAGEQRGELLDRLVADFATGDADAVASWTDVDWLTVDRRARHPAATRAERKAATAWQFELVDKPLDGAITIHIYRRLARPITRLFLRLPLSPNAISVLAGTISLTGCALAAGPSYRAHLLGLLVLLLGGVLDCTDGEVARLRLETSTTGAWLDAIGDDLSRLALIVAVGLHIAPAHPTWPIAWLTAATVALTLASMLLIYWYCIFVLGSSNNQDYNAAVGLGPGSEAGAKPSLVRRLGDLAAQAARRDFFDLCVLLLAVANLPEVSFTALGVGAVGALAVVLPTHFRLVRSLHE